MTHKRALKKLDHAAEYLKVHDKERMPPMRIVGGQVLEQPLNPDDAAQVMLGQLMCKVVVEMHREQDAKRASR